MLLAEIRRKAFLMDEIKNPLKVVPLVGDVEKIIPHPDNDTEFRGLAFKGIFYGFACYLVLAVVFGLCYGLAWVLQHGLHWIID